MGRCENSSFSDLLNLCTICNQSFQPGQLIHHQNEAHDHVTLDKRMGTIRKETPERNDDDVGQLTDNDDDFGDDDEDDSDDASSISSWGSATTIDDDERMDLEDFPLVISGAGFVSNEKDEELFTRQDEDFIGKIEQVFTIKDSNVMNKEKDTTTTTIQTDRNVMDDDDNMDLFEAAGSSTDLSSIMIQQQQQQQQLNSSFAINSRRNLTEIKSPPPSLSPTSSTSSQPAGLETENDRDKNCNEEKNDVDQQQVVNSRSNFSAHDDDNDVQCIEPDVSSTATTPQTLSSSRRISKHNYHRFQARDVNFDVGNQQRGKSSIRQNAGGLRSQFKSDACLSVESSTVGAIRRKIESQRKIGMKKMNKISNIATTAKSKSILKARKNVGKNWEPGFIYVEATDGTGVTKHPIKPLLKNKYFVAESDPLAIPDGGLDQEEDEEVGSQSPPLLFSNFFPSETSSESPPLVDDDFPLKLRPADSRRNSDSNNNNNSISPLKIISPKIQTPQKDYEDFDESCDDDGPSKIRKIVRSKFNRKLIENLVRTLERKSSMSKTSFKGNGKKVVPAKRGSYKKKFSMPILAAPNVIPLDEILANKIMNNSHNDSSSSSSSSTLSTHCPQSDGHVGQVKRKVGRPRKSEGAEMFSEEDDKNESFESEQHHYYQQDFSRSGRRIKKSTKFLDYELDA